MVYIGAVIATGTGVLKKAAQDVVVDVKVGPAGKAIGLGIPTAGSEKV